MPYVCPVCNIVVESPARNVGRGRWRAGRCSQGHSVLQARPPLVQFLIHLPNGPIWLLIAVIARHLFPSASLISSILLLLGGVQILIMILSSASLIWLFRRKPDPTHRLVLMAAAGIVGDLLGVAIAAALWLRT